MPKPSPQLIHRWFSAIKSNDRTTIAAMLAAGFDVDTRDSAKRTGAFVCATYGLVGSFWAMCDHAHPNLERGLGYAPGALWKAVDAGHFEMVEALVSQGARLDILGGPDNDTPIALHACRSTFKDRIFGLLVEAGADVDACTLQGVSARNYLANIMSLGESSTQRSDARRLMKIMNQALVYPTLRKATAVPGAAHRKEPRL